MLSRLKNRFDKKSMALRGDYIDFKRKYIHVMDGLKSVNGACDYNGGACVVSLSLSLCMQSNGIGTNSDIQFSISQTDRIEPLCTESLILSRCFLWLRLHGNLNSRR